ncbi:MAG: hypothetical protein HC893_13985, partial [Chloroflexaceae bacterium]|nr:hypothetical protein [Chloroflexaceae bacterium]
GLGNRNEEHRTWAQWRGEIDTRAPQAELIGTLEVFNEAILNLPFEGTTATVFSDTAGLSLNPSCMSDRCPTLDTTSPVSDGLRFDGNDYLLIPNDPALNIQGTMTLAAWVRPQATDSIRNIIARGYMLTPNGEVFLRIANGQYQIGSWNGTDHFASSAAGVATADIGQWVHLVGTYDGTTWRLYRNGVAIATQAALTGAVPVNSPWAIGARFTGSERHFVGGIDEAGIFNRAWSANEVQTFYTNMLNGTGDTFPQDGALFYLDANKTPAPAYMDVSAAMNNAACGTAAQCPTPVPGSPSGQALSFDGVDDTLTVPGINVADQSFSIGFWARRTRLNVNDFIIAQGTAGSTRQGLHIGFRSNNTFTCALWGDDVNSPSVPDTNWHHWLCTYDTATRALTLYRDGVAVATRTTAGNYTGSGDLLIGRYLAGITGFNFQGRLDQINVFGRALTTEEAQALYIATGGLGIPPSYRCRVQDLNLVLDSYTCLDVTTVASSDRTSYDTPLWRELAGDAGAAPRTIGIDQEFATGIVTNPVLTVCDIYQRCTTVGPSLLASPFAPIPTLPSEMPPTFAQGLAAVDEAPTLAQATAVQSAIVLPTGGTLLTSTVPISVSGVALSVAGIATLDFAANGESIGSFDLNSIYGDNRTAHRQTLDWTPPADGVYGLRLTVQDTDGAVATSQPVTVTVDTTPPEISISSEVLAGYGRGETLAAPFVLRGTATDAAAVRSVEVRINDGMWMPAELDGAVWSISAQQAINLITQLDDTGTSRVLSPDGDTFTVQARAFDVAGRVATTSRTVLVDFAAPEPVNVTFGYESSQGNGTLAPGDILRNAPATLVLEWEASSDGSGLLDYAAGWTTTPDLSIADIPATGPIPTLTSYATDAARRHTQAVGDADVRYAHLVSRDLYGNTHIQSYGPFYIDSPLTPDLLTMPVADGRTLAQADTPPRELLKDYTGIFESACTLVGASRKMASQMGSQSTLADVQRFYATWDNNALRLTWEGANWQGDGDLFLYFDSTAGGSNRAFTPYPVQQTRSYLPLIVGGMAGATLTQDGGESGGSGRVVVEPGAITLPFAADTVLWIEDAQQVQLLTWSTISDTWVLDDTFPARYVWDDISTQRTNAYLPFDVLRVNNAAPLNVIALASEENALHLWGTMPAGNPLNSPRAVNPALADRFATSLFALQRYYTWDTLNAGACPSDNKT